jgi:hypothetical protein
LLLLLLLWAATWSLSHGYDGIRHDGELYTLQALAHLRPDSLSHDVFLSFGSQDRFTLFSPVYARLAGLLGVEPAAAILTLISQLAFLASALFLVRKAVSPALALVGLSVLIAVPGTYGAQQIFSCIESFVTPRMAAEALVLCSLAAALGHRRALALMCLLAATLLHPVMAAVGFVALACLYIAIPKPRVAAIWAVASVMMLTGLALAWPSGLFTRFDAEWLRLVRLRSPHLFLANWTADDWARACVPLATLAVGVGIQARNNARALCQIGLLAGIGGLVLTLLACDLLRLVSFTQLQPWRWLWLPTTLAPLLLPAIALAGWENGSAGRTTVLLLGAAWIFAPDPLSPSIALVSIVFSRLSGRLPANTARLISYGAYGLLGLAIAARLGSNSLFLESHYQDPAIPAWIRYTASFTHDGLVPVAIALLVVWLASASRGVYGLLVLAVVGTVTCICLAPETWKRWTQRQFPPALTAEFAPWRALIPPSSRVLWPESALQTWLLLERPNYLSLAQTAGLVFSRRAAMEMQRRAVALSVIVPPESFFRWSGTGFGLAPAPEKLERACHTGELDFIVTGSHLSRPALAEVPRIVWRSSGGLRLYRCSDWAD